MRSYCFNSIFWLAFSRTDPGTMLLVCPYWFWLNGNTALNMSKFHLNSWRKLTSQTEAVLQIFVKIEAWVEEGDLF